MTAQPIQSTQPIEYPGVWLYACEMVGDDGVRRAFGFSSEEELIPVAAWARLLRVAQHIDPNYHIGQMTRVAMERL